jgi:Zn-dependent protease with chaperone function
MKKALAVLLMASFLCLPSVVVYAMSFEEEHKVAQEVITYLDAQGLIVYDREISWPVKMIADRLADHIKNPMYTFNVHVIMDRSVNAFTIPDGQIFINVGTLLFAKDLDEIAAVIGHEMGHAQLRHIPQSLEEQKEVTAASIAGVILGALLSTKNPQAGAALVYSSLGGGQNIQLAYSRRHERDADEFGNQLMSASGFEPSAMNRFLVRLGTFSGNSNVPEYLLTHPYITNRISGQSPDIQKSKPDSYYWTLFASACGLILPVEEAVQRAQDIPDPYRRLTLAMAETRKGRHEKALDLLKGVDLPLAYSYKGLNLYQMGKKDEAYPLLKQYGNSADAQIALADIMEGKGEFDQAVAALLPYQKQNAQVDYKLGILYDKSSREALSHVSFARYFFKTGKSKATLYHIDKALEQKKDLEASVVDELKEMKEYMKKIVAS